MTGVQTCALPIFALGGTIEKGGTAPAVMGGFAFVEWDDVAEKIGTLLAQNGVMPFPSMTEHSNEHIGDTSTGKPIYRASVTVVLELVNVDNPEDRATLSWPGTGDDGSDKAVQKAGTSAEKYALLKLFMLKGEKGASVDPDASGEAVEKPAERPARSSGTVTRPPAGNRPQKAKTGRSCPECGTGDLELVTFPDGGHRIECSNWRDCKYREAAPRLTGVGAAVSAAADAQQQTFEDGTPIPDGPS